MSVDKVCRGPIWGITAHCSTFPLVDSDVVQFELSWPFEIRPVDKLEAITRVEIDDL